MVVNKLGMLNKRLQFYTASFLNYHSAEHDEPVVIEI